MPICQMKTNYRFDAQKRTDFMNEIASAMAELVEKPLPAVMVMLDDFHMLMNQSEDTVFFGEFRYLRDFSDADERKAWLDVFADRMLEIIQKYTGVNPNRVYMQFTEMTRESAWKYTPPSKK
ncbi:MAG: hypothetical protein IJY29_00395 [Ruminococcus sp.]|nr:hypothetical protein [Ruminococcus sp.]